MRVKVFQHFIDGELKFFNEKFDTGDIAQGFIYIGLFELSKVKEFVEVHGIIAPIDLKENDSVEVANMTITKVIRDGKVIYPKEKVKKWIWAIFNKHTDEIQTQTITHFTEKEMEEHYNRCNDYYYKKIHSTIIE